MSNEIVVRIQQVLGNLVWTYNITQIYVDKDEPWLGILSAYYFSLRSTTNCLKVYIPGQLVFGRDMILLIKHNVDWELISQKIRRKIIKIISGKIETEFTKTKNSDIN